MRTAILAGWVAVLAACPVSAVEKAAIDRAVDRGVAALKSLQRPDGTWESIEIGATALVGLALLEGGVPPEDRSIRNAARAIRESSLMARQTYSIALAILFLDRLDERSDTPLIESLVVRLLAGQRSDGGWSYICPTPAPEEARRIQAEMAGARDLKGARDLTRLPPKGKRKQENLPSEIVSQLALITRAGGGVLGVDAGLGSDNSNTQFATIAVWVGRRYGIPVQDALIRLGDRFRKTQHSDGGWSYSPLLSGIPLGGGMGGSTATMTCAGTIGLICSHGAAHDIKIKKSRDSKTEKQDVSKDVSLKAALAVLSTAVGTPVGWNGNSPRPAVIAAANGKAYYFLWSLERCMVALELDKLAGKDWYTWGAEILLANQSENGTWVGDYASYGGADTAFAVLFLKKANFTRDLSGNLTGMNGEGRVLRGASTTKLDPALSSSAGFDNRKGVRTAPGKTPSPRTDGSSATKSEGAGQPTRPMLEKPRPRADTPEEKATVNLGENLLRTRGEERAAILKQLRDNKGVVNTETLVWVISRLDDDGRKRARVALAERFTRLKDATLREYLQDEEAEIRRAAALASAARGSKGLVPDLIRRLSDSEELVQRAAGTALKELTKKDFGPTPGATPAERKEAIAAWLKWWKENSRE
ncbi:MAG: HEAT repeat domain-containing protein [Gemmataceae bacterium]